MCPAHALPAVGLLKIDASAWGNRFQAVAARDRLLVAWLRLANRRMLLSSAVHAVFLLGGRETPARPTDLVLNDAAHPHDAPPLLGLIRAARLSNPAGRIFLVQVLPIGIILVLAIAQLVLLLI